MSCNGDVTNLAKVSITFLYIGKSTAIMIQVNYNSHCNYTLHPIFLSGNLSLVDCISLFDERYYHKPSLDMFSESIHHTEVFGELGGNKQNHPSVRDPDIACPLNESLLNCSDQSLQ